MTHLAANGNCLVMVSLDGTVSIQGQLRDGKGDTRLDSNRLRPLDTRTLSKEGIKSISLGHNHLVLLSLSGELYGLGSNHKAQLLIPQEYSTCVTRLTKAQGVIREVFCHKDSTFLIDQNYEVTFCGQVGST